MPTGTLTKKIHSQLSCSVRMPPSSRPNAPPPAAIALHTPSAFVRSAPSAKVVVMMDSAAGETSAAPRPCSARDATSHSDDVASPLSSDAVVKTITPATKTLRRPTRSPARPPSSRKPPNTSVYALMTHCRLDVEKPRSRWIEGSATFTIVASRMTMNCARQTMTRTSQRLVSPEGGGSTGSARSATVGAVTGPPEWERGRAEGTAPGERLVQTLARNRNGGSPSGAIATCRPQSTRTYVRMPSAQTRTAALALSAAGHDDADVGRRLGVPRRTVRDWRTGTARARPACLRCWQPTRPVVMTSADYAELLGLYLGDGHISRTSRTYRVRIALDARYPGIVGDTRSLLARCFPGNRVGGLIADGGSTAVVWVY